MLTKLFNLFKPRQPWGYHLQIDLFDCDHYTVRSGIDIHEYILSLCTLIEMVRYGETNLMRFGEGDLEGWSFAQMIETSCICGHFREDGEHSDAYIDIFSCQKFNYQDAIDFTKNYFEAKKIKVRKRSR